MKNVLLAAAAIAALGGCQKPATTSNETNETATANSAATSPAPAAAAMVTANGSTPGTFEVTAKDGKKSQSVLNADGTYVDTDASGKEIGRGTWNVTNGKTCFDPAGNEGPECFTETAPAADGTFTATSDKQVVTVKKVS
jgi:PBP1b-binding outer membrane lipoprotein LpoB